MPVDPNIPAANFKIFALEKEAHPLCLIKAKNMPLEAAITNEIAKAYVKTSFVHKFSFVNMSRHEHSDG